MSVSRFFARCSLLAALVAAPLAAQAITWRGSLDDKVFADAAREHRFIILDLHAVWCHWCHVMDDTTYADAKVRALLDEKFVTVSIDADSDPDLASRYGNWGWPATIVLAADGTEIVKRRGYIPPAPMASLLKAIIDDPSPGPSVVAAASLVPQATGELDPAERQRLEAVVDQLYDDAHGGWGTVHKYLDAASLELAFARSDAGDHIAERRARQTLDRNLALIDPVWGGVYQYSDAVDWSSPHFEKLMAFQADDLRLYAEAYARWQDPRYEAAARAIYGYIVNFLAAPDGGFYVSQDADASAAVPGALFYARSATARRVIGAPRIDTHEYARETGWAARALCKWYDVSGDASALKAAERGARWAMAERRVEGGGFRHDATDRGGPFLDDNVAMTEAFVALYRSTGDRRWLDEAILTLDFVNRSLRDPSAGYLAAEIHSPKHGVFREPVRTAEENAALARVANLIGHYSGDERDAAIARHALRYLRAVAVADPETMHAEVLLADGELATAPTHITVIGPKHDPSAIALHVAALRYPADYLQVDWWDRSEGQLPNGAVHYPVLARAAAFACTGSNCSLPVYDAGALLAAVRAAREP